MIRIKELKWQNCVGFNYHAWKRLKQRGISFESIRNVSWYVYDIKKSHKTGLKSVYELHNYSRRVGLVIDWLDVIHFEAITGYKLTDRKFIRGIKKLKNGRG